MTGGRAANADWACCKKQLLFVHHLQNEVDRIMFISYIVVFMCRKHPSVLFTKLKEHLP